MTYFIGIDIGGTFTDCVVLDGEGRIATIAKSPTRRDNPDQGVITAVAVAARRMNITPEALLGECRFFVHGCTVATNAMVERKGVRTALLTTRGHEDAIFIGKASQKVAGRTEREMNHQSHLEKATPPIVAPRDVFGINERVDARGEVVVELNEEDVARAIASLRESGVEAVAISFLWSFLASGHEREVKERVQRDLPGVYVCASHELAPLIGEYERTATTVANAYVGPKLIGYLENLGARLAQSGYRYPLLLAHCMGGLTTLEEIRTRPLLTLDSGPVSGVLGARYFGEVYGEPDIICADMGGTTFDVALIENGNYVLDEEPVIDRYTCLIPKVAVESVGAGGGSIVWCDDNRLLRVGPHSAGAEPGPACYGHGGTLPTVSDVNLVLGYLNPEAFLGGEMRLDRAAAERVVAEVAAQAGLDCLEAAAGAFKIVNANMADLIRRCSIDRGRDARDFVLFAYGGAGGLHIAYLARDLGISKVYVPSFATVFSALGMLTGGIVHAAERSSLAPFPMPEERWRELGAMFESLEEGLGTLFEREGVAPEVRHYTRYAHVKYRLQPRALAVPVTADFASPDAQNQLLAAFQRQYAALYGANAGYGAATIEIVKCRVEGSAQMVAPRLATAPLAIEQNAAAALKSERMIYLTELGKTVSAAVYDGDRLERGIKIAGPAIIERMGDTLLLPSFAAGVVDEFGNFVVELQDEKPGEATGTNLGFAPADASRESRPLDPVTLEVLRNRLAMINDEQGRVASQLSGSPVVYEAKDFNSALLTPEGEGLFVGIYMTRLSLCVNGFAQAVMSRFKDNLGYVDGDAFVTNDPWAGAAHMNDFLMIAPIFHGDTLVCWTGLAMHEVDVGGPNPGSFTVATPDVFGEAPLIPPVKLVERGRIREDIEALLSRNSRTPRLNGLNMRARIAAINRTRQRIAEVIAEYGLETVMRAQREILNLARASFERRLRSMPDGTWINEGFLDHDGNENRLYRLRATLTKSGGRVKIDFTGTDAQARGAVNCARTGLESGILSAVLPMLCYDIPWSTGGILPLIDIVSEEGTINNARHPAGVSMATVSAIFATAHVTYGAIAKMLACSTLREEIQANWAPAWQGVTMAGHFRGGQPFTAVLLDETGGSGARAAKDGIDAGGLPGSPAMAIANVEVYEKEHPILYVYRRQAPDTGGQGLYRGGVGTEGMLIPHGNEGPIDLTRIAHGVSQPEAQGLYGGYPSSVQVALLLRQSDHREQFSRRHIPVSVENLSAASVEPMMAKQRTRLQPEDAIVIVCAGGGGYGDPLLREPLSVLADVQAGLVSLMMARDIYGVAIATESATDKAAMTDRQHTVHKVDAAQTVIMRQAIREARRKGSPTPSELPDVNVTGVVAGHAQRIGEALIRVNGEHGFRCQNCQAPLGGGIGETRAGALSRRVMMASLSPWNRYGLTDEIIVREYCCPECAHLVSVEVRRKDDGVLYDTRLGN